jgi:excisionase family DNA binding protein
MPSDPALAIPAEQLWTVHDVADFLRLGRNAVYEMAKRGEVPSVRICSRVRFIPAEVREWATKQREAAVVPIFSRP